MRAEGPPGLRDLLHRQDGVVSRGQALRHLTARMVERRLSSGRWQAPHLGVYVTHTGPLGRPEARWIAILGTVAGRTAFLGGLSALEVLGLRGFGGPGEGLGGPGEGIGGPGKGFNRRGDGVGGRRGSFGDPGERVAGPGGGVGGPGGAEIHVLLPSRLTVRRPPDGVIVHRTTLMRSVDLWPGSRLPCTSPARSLIDAAQWQSSERRARAIVAAGFQQRLVRADDMRSMLAAMPRLRHRRAISEAVEYSVGGAHSLPEADFLALCRRAGLPAPMLQHARHDRNGRQRYLDAYFPAQRLHVEIDGGQHMDVEQWWADMHRQNALWIPGDRVLRFPAWAIRRRPNEVLAQLKAALTHQP